MCGLRVSNPQLGAMPKVALVSLSVDRYFKEHPSTILGPRREIHKLYLDGELSYAEWIDLIRSYSETLQELWLLFDTLSRDIVEAIGACTKLRHLQLNPLSGFSEYSQLEAILRGASNVEYLEIFPHCDLTDETLSEISKLQRLKRLTVRGTTCASDEVLRKLGTISTLQYLGLNGFEPNASVIRGLASLKNLRGLYLSYTPITLEHGLDSECFDIICGSFENLEELALDRLWNLTDADAVKLCRLKNLRELSLEDASRFTDLTFKEGLGSPTLTELRIWWSLLTDAGLASIASNHKMFRTISLFHCHMVTDAGIIFLLEREPLLQKFNVRDCSSLRGRWLEALGNLCPRLGYLGALDHTSTDPGLSEFRVKRPGVSVQYGV